MIAALISIYMYIDHHFARASCCDEEFVWLWINTDIANMGLLYIKVSLKAIVEFLPQGKNGYKGNTGTNNVELESHMSTKEMWTIWCTAIW